MLNSDTVVLDSEWHWIFDCTQFSSLRETFPHFSTILRSIREKSSEQNYCIETDLRNLLHSIHDDSKCGFSFASFIRQAIIVRKAWFEEVSVRGRLCAPPSHWNRNIFSSQLDNDEVPADVLEILILVGLGIFMALYINLLVLSFFYASP